MTDEIPAELFDILSCPVCKGRLEHTADKTGVRCSECKTNYPVEDGIPVILPPKK